MSALGHHNLREAGLPRSEHLVRDRSKLIFGNRDRLDVAVAVARSGGSIVNATEISAEIGIAPNRVRANLIALAQAGLLDDAPESSGRRWFVRRTSPFWNLCVALHDAWSADATESALARMVGRATA